LYTKLSDVKLKTDETMEIGVILSPHEELADTMVNLLGHKGKLWMSHVKMALKGEITGLETRFYVGQVDGQIIVNIMTVECNRTGILGHVFTRPEHRRKRACSLVMDHQMEDFQRRGSGLLLLGTGYDSAAYWIYHKHGFRGLSEGSGFMRFANEADFEASHFASGNAKAVDVEWKHWPLINALTSVPGVEVLRSVTFRLYGIGNFEGGFLGFAEDWMESHRKKVKLLESASGAIAGCATLELSREWRSKTYLLDIFVHPNFLSHYSTLLNALELPKGKTLCYVDTTSPEEKTAALQQAGFEREALLKNQFEWDGKWFDVFVYSRFAE